MNNRIYTIFFHLHTVSGISISIGLFVIFFAGAFTLFREEIGEWEGSNYQKVINKSSVTPPDYDRIMDSLTLNITHIYGREIYMNENGKANFSVYLTPSSDTTAKGKATKATEFSIDLRNYELKEKTTAYSLGSLLYLLHFYYQLEQPGYWISGFVALFFFLAIITGILIHWKKIISNFYIFRPKAKLKTIWADAHTALGVIGLPFQFLYALTGAMFGLGVIVSSFSAIMIYDGNTSKLYSELLGNKELKLGEICLKNHDFNSLVEKTEQKWSDFNVNRITIKNFGSTTMRVIVEGEQRIQKRFLGNGKIEYDGNTGEEISLVSPGKASLYNSTWNAVHRLHYAKFGEIKPLSNYLLKATYFFLAFITCFVILSGVLIWMEARNKKNNSLKKKKFINWTGRIYLSSCLSMLPLTAFAFIISKLIPVESDLREAIISNSFFLGWLVITILFIIRNDNFSITKFSLQTTGISGILIPFVNGFSSGNWFWITLKQENYGVFVIDILWLIIGILCLYISLKLKNNSINVIKT